MLLNSPHPWGPKGGKESINKGFEHILDCLLESLQVLIENVRTDLNKKTP